MRLRSALSVNQGVASSARTVSHAVTANVTHTSTNDATHILSLGCVALSMGLIGLEKLFSEARDGTTVTTRSEAELQETFARLWQHASANLFRQVSKSRAAVQGAFQRESFKPEEAAGHGAFLNGGQGASSNGFDSGDPFEDAVPPGACSRCMVVHEVGGVGWGRAGSKLKKQAATPHLGKQAT